MSEENDPFADLVPTKANGPTTRKATRQATRAHSSKRGRKPAYNPKPKRSYRGWIGGLIALAVFGALVAIALNLYLEPIKGFLAGEQTGPTDYPGPGTGEVVFTVHDGDFGSDIAANLQKDDVIGSSEVFYKLLLQQSPEPVFIPGAYKMRAQMTAKGALTALMNPNTRMENTFVIPEGTVVRVALELIADGTKIPLKELQAAAEDYTSFGLPEEAINLEGFLFPATYNLEPGLSAHQVLQVLVDRMDQALDDAKVAKKDRFRVVTFASLVQREAGGDPGDAAKVARVFQNRLDEGWKLQSDATVTYYRTTDIDRTETSDAERADASNPYNTYVHEGLPIGPISNPGDVAINAVLHPADGPWMFFVTWNLKTGETIFSTTIEEHDAAVAKWREWMSENPGYG